MKQWQCGQILRLQSVSPVSFSISLYIGANCENSSESDKLSVDERDSECHKAVVSGSEVHKADEVSEVRLVGEIDDELDEVDYDEVCEVGEAEEWRWAGWGLWSPSSWRVMMITDELDKVCKVGEFPQRARLMNRYKYNRIWLQPQHSASPSHAPQLETIITILLCWSIRLVSSCS